MKCKVLILMLFLRLTIIVAQEAALTTGTDAVGNGGSISYSIGQIVYTSNRGNAGLLTQGVQQSYEVSIVTGIENDKINIEVSAFPNPTMRQLVLAINNDELLNLTFQLFDIKGNLLQEEKITKNQTIVDLAYYSAGVYFIKILKNKQELKSFKIIKN